MILFFVCPTYLVWHQLHSRQYITLLLCQVPLVIVLLGLLLCKFLIFPDWEIFLQYLQVLSLLTARKYIRESPDCTGNELTLNVYIGGSGLDNKMKWQIHGICNKHVDHEHTFIS